MKITVKTFASVSDRCGFREKVYDLLPGSSVDTLLEQMTREHPGLGALRPQLLFAVNEEHSPAGRTLSDNDTVAVFPPVSGG